jgi:phage tail tape measure protein, TP901 family
MSIRVSGITLRVEGAEQFASQLDTANKAMRRNAAEMKLLEATYANSKNSDYFGKQSELLTKQLEEQRKKTATLQQARDAYAQTPGADASKLEQLDLKILKSQTDEAKLTAEIQKCNAAMQKAQEQQQALGDATEETGQAADDAASAQANLAESTSEAGNQQRSAAENAKHYGEALDKLAKGATQAGKALTKVLTLPIVGMGTASVKYGMELEDAVYEVATLPGVLSGTQEQRQQQIRDLTDELIDASNDAHTAATELASATYDAISAGVAPEDAAYWAERAAMAGKAGRSDASTVINGASSIYNAWGEKASGGLDHILDSMITAQNLGKTTVGELSSQIGQVSGLAPQLSLSMEEVLSSVAALTAGGLSTSSAITGLRGVLSAVIKPTSEAAEMAKELGIDFSAAGLKAKGFTGFLAEIASVTEGDSEKLGKLFGSVEGLNAVMMLGTTAADKYHSILAEMTSASGTLDAAFETRVSSRSAQLEGAMNRLKNTGVELAQNLYPAVDAVTNAIGGVADYVGQLDAGTQQTIVNLGLMAAALGPTLTGIGKMITAGKVLASVMTGPFGWAAAGVALIGGGLTLAIKAAGAEAEEFRNRADAFELDFEAPDAVSMQEAIQKNLDQINLEYKNGIKLTSNVWTDIGKQVQEAFDSAVADGKIDASEYADLSVKVGVRIMAEANDGATSDDVGVREVATQLQNAVADYNALLQTVYRKGNSATDEELNALQAALDRVMALRNQMMGLEAETESLEASTYKSYFDLVASGHGSEEAVASAAAYAIGVYQQKMAEIEAQRKAEIAISDERQAEAREAGASDEELTAYDAALAERQTELNTAENEVNAQFQADVAAILEGMAKQNPEAWQYIQTGGEQIRLLSSMQAAMQADSMNFAENWLRDNMTPELLTTYASYGEKYGLNWWNDPEQVRKYAADPSQMSGFDLGNTYRALNEGIREAHASWLEQDAQEGMDAINGVMASLLENGFSLDSIDASSATGVLADYMRLMLFADNGVDALGSDAMEAIGSGITESSQGLQETTQDAVAPVQETLDDLSNQEKTGKAVGVSLAAGILSSKRMTQQAAAEIRDAVNSTLAGIGFSGTLTLPGTGLIQRSGLLPSTTYVGGNTDFSTNVVIRSANFQSQTTPRVFAEQVSALNRAKLAGYGVT